ncbi:labd-13Z-ene-9,15,16-triol synthase, chloroplastic-like [Benincasa hispida]|uniref:labd-13Z-ene-9,15,16-triol synthase, chloroplastic-like n=1 Tax=Benincasa hispida TaxID=102211 RepID=UPI0019016F93|nr:labd-13Z-ene-9,15,16-triol synthase, chloroplastic-like [Benincasa hispida]
MSISAPFSFFLTSFWSVDSNEDKQLSFSILLVVLTFALFWFRPKLRRPSLPPGPRGLPLVGYLPFLSANPHHKLTHLADIYGPVFKLRLGTKLSIVLTSPDSIKEAFRHQEALLPNRDTSVCAFLSSYGGSGIVFTQDDGDWKKLRKIFVRKMLSKSNLDASYSVRRQEVRKVIKGVFETARTQIEIRKVGFLAALKSVMAMTWGDSGRLIGEDGVDLEVKFREVMDELVVLLGTPNVSDFFPVLGRFDLQGIAKRTKKVMRACDEILNSAIEEQRKMGGNGVEKGGYLQMLLELQDNEDSSECITDDQLKALLLDIVIGGTETTATTIEWAMAELMQHPNTMKKVKEELKEVIGLNAVAEEFHFSKLCYLNAVIKETLRLHPPIFFLVPRILTSTTTFGGYSIPTDSTIYFNIWAIQRDSKAWNNPLNFMPERFLNNCAENDEFIGDSAMEFCPFGYGKRSCAGIPLAERMLMFILTSLLHSFEWELPKDSVLDFKERFGIVNKKFNPLVAIPTPTLSNLDLYMA